MNNSLRPLLIILLVAAAALGGGVSTSAQQKIEKIASTLANSKIDKGEIVTYSVRRPAANKESARTTLIVNFEKDSPWIDRIIRTLNDEEPNATEFHRQKNEFYMLKFNAEGKPSIIATLTRQNSRWQFTYQLTGR